MPTIEEFRAYARLDEDDPMAQFCLDAAVGVAEMAGVPPMDDSPAYDMTVYALALHYYDNRGFSPGVAVDGREQDAWVSRRITSLLIALDMEAKRRAKEGGKDGNT